MSPPTVSAAAALVALPVRDERVRRIVKAAAVGGGGLLGVGTAVAGALVGVLIVEAQLARRAIGPRKTVPPYVDGRYLPPHGGAKRTSLRLCFLGDSSAAGLGVDHADKTAAVLVARAVAAVADRPVSLSNVAVVGARSRDLDLQVTRALQQHPQIAVIMIGANDITHRDRPQKSVRLLVNAVERLQLSGCKVVVGTCPDLGTIRPVAQPLRAYARRASRELAAAQAAAVESVDGQPVRLADALGARFHTSPEKYFSADRFHPSAAGYADCAGELIPAVLAALGLPSPATSLARSAD
jgi:lysophospholipase L1-like esterase